MNKTVSISVPAILKNKLTENDKEIELSKLLKKYYLKAIEACQGLNWQFQVFKGDQIVKIALNEVEFQAIKNIQDVPKNVGNTLNARALAILYGYFFPKNLQNKNDKKSTCNDENKNIKIINDDVINHTLKAYVQSSGKTENPDQERLSKNLMRTLNSTNDMQMAEASTGVGKGAVIVTAAIEQVLRGNAPVIVAAPTFKILNQLIKEHVTVEKSINKMISHVLIFGKNEFISSDALLEWKNDEIESLQNLKEKNDNDSVVIEIIKRMEKIIHDIEVWVNDGAPDNPDAIYKKDWALSGLKYHVPDFDNEVSCILSNIQQVDDEDRGLLAYKQQFIDSLSAGITYCSHSMLARDTIRKLMSKYRALRGDADQKAWFDKSINEFLNSPADDKNDMTYINYLSMLVKNVESEDISNGLPETTKLIIDEAHLFEENFSNSVSFGVSINKLINNVKNIHPNASVQLRQLQDKIIALSGNENILWIDNRDRSMEVISAIKEMKTIITKKVLPKINKKKRKTAKDHFIYEGNNALTAISNMNESLLSLISFSQIRKYPSIYSSKKNIEKELNFLWEGKAVCLVSATLYIPTPGNPHDERPYMNILSIPKNRHVGMVPIRPKWIVEPVTFMTPEVNNDRLIKRKEADLLKSIKSVDELSESGSIEDVEWIKDIAKYLVDARDTTVGGTLVLMTSYDTVHQLETQLHKMAPDIPIITSKRGVNIENNTRKFVLNASQHIKPIWLATGQSWTGTDVSGRNLNPVNYDPATDNILTDLVIPKLPFRVNRSISHIQRSKLSYVAEINMTITILIQGIGRLVRSRGLPHNRRIHFLDKRMYTQNHYEAIEKQFNFVHKRYNNRKNVKFDTFLNKWIF